MNTNEMEVTGDAPAPAGLGYRMASIQYIYQSPTNPRKFFDQQALEELAASIREHGILQPLVVRPLPDGFLQLVAGERRWRAAQIANVFEVPVICRALSDKEVLEIQWIENLMRKDLTAIEEAEGFRIMLDSGGYTVETLMEKLCVSRSYIFGRLKLCKLSEDSKEAVRAGIVEFSIAQLAAQIGDPAKQREFLNEVIARELPFREAQRVIEHRFQRQLKEAKFNPKDGALVAGAPACKACPKRSGHPDMVALFPHLATSPHVCTDVACFAAKTAAHFQALQIAAEDAGKKVMSAKEWDKVPYGKYIELGEQSYIGGEWQVWRKALKGAELETEMAWKRDELIEVMPKDKAAAAAKKLGIEFARSSSGTERAEQKKRKEKKNLASLTVAAAAPALFVKLEIMDPRELAQLMGVCVYRTIENDEKAMKWALAFLGQPVEKGADPELRLENALAELKNTGEMKMAILAMLLADDAVGDYTGDFGRNLLDAAKAVGLNLADYAPGKEGGNAKVNANKKGKKT